MITPAVAEPAKRHGSLLPWVVVGMVFLATGLNFLDRQVLSFVIIKIQTEFNISNVQYGWVNTCFLVGYAIMFTGGGWLMDRLGARVGLALAVGFWSLVECLHGAMTGFAQLLVLRLLLGIGEGGCFPGAVRAVCEWFDEKKRALANGIAIGGAAIGAVLAPPSTVYLSVNFGWRMSFIIPGMIGLLWVAIWWFLPRNAKAAETKSASPGSDRHRVVSFWAIVRNRHAITFMALRAMLDPIVLFLMFWAPKYLNEQRGISFERVGALMWIPFLALGISNMIGGWVSDRLVAKGASLNVARKSVMGIAAALTMACPLVAFVSSAETAVGLMAVFMFAHGFWITNYVTSIADMFGKYATATVMGLAGTAGSIVGFIVNPVIGKVVQELSYTPLWIIAGVMYPLAFVVFMIRIRRIEAVYASSA